MKFGQVYERCKMKGINISRNALYLAGIKYGFIERDIDHINIFHKEKFEKWLEKKLEKVPEGYSSLKECSEKLNKPLQTIYYLVNTGIKSGKLNFLKIGTKEIKYVKLEELREFIRIRKYGSEEEYGN